MSEVSLTPREKNKVVPPLGTEWTSGRIRTQASGFPVLILSWVGDYLWADHSSVYLSIVTEKEAGLAQWLEGDSALRNSRGGGLENSLHDMRDGSWDGSTQNMGME